MKKIAITCLFLSITVAISAQYVESVEFNDIRARVNNDGTFFINRQNTTAAYEVPKGTGKNALFFMNAYAIGINDNDEFAGAYSTYDQTDFSPGPIATNYTDQSYLNRYQSSLWPVYRYDIENHKTNWNQSGYVTPSSILNWPGNGNGTNGEAQFLAPFFDNNGDNIYTPTDGDYPLIRGSFAVYCILNDEGKTHPTGTKTVGMELHVMFYQYATNDALNRTTFLSTTLINRGNQTISNLHFGSFIDFDLGNYSDDYMGTNVDKNLAYVYNGDLIDEDDNGSPGYGENPPALGVVSLNEDLYSHIILPSSAGDFTNNSYYNLLRGLTPDGSSIKDDNNQATRFAYSEKGSGWNESTQDNPPGDRRGNISFSAVNFTPGMFICHDLAIIYAPNADGTLFGSVDSLELVADFVQNLYDAESYGCKLMEMSISEKNNPTMTVHPNPATNTLYISDANFEHYTITGLDGKIIKTGNGQYKSIPISELKAGYYLLVLETNQGLQSVPFIKN
jgi:hypothetical protein